MMKSFFSILLLLATLTPNLSAQDELPIRLVVEGKGQTKAEAIENAKREALAQAFGFYVDPEGESERQRGIDEIFQNKSVAYFTYVDERRAFKENGQYRVEIEAGIKVSVIVVTAKGRAAPSEGGEQMALRRALKRAVEQITGVYISQRQMLSRGRLITEVVSKESEGFVKYHNYLKPPWTEPSGNILVEVEVGVIPNALRKSVQKLKEPTSIVVVVAQIVDGTTMEDSLIEKWLIRDMINFGYVVQYSPPSLRTLLQENVNLRAGSKFSPITQKQYRGVIERISLSALADIIIIGKADVKLRDFDANGFNLNARTAEADVTIAALEADSLRYIAQSPPAVNERGSHRRDRCAIEYALSDAYETMTGKVPNEEDYSAISGKFLGKLMEKSGNPKRIVVVYIAGLPNAGAFDLLAKRLSGYDWVKKVKKDFHSSSHSKFNLILRPSPAGDTLETQVEFLRKMIDRNEEYEVESFNPREIFIKYKP